MANICVFCGSAPGASPVYAASARELASAMAAAGFDLVYGGAHVGLMGIVADEMLGLGRSVFGVIPADMVDRELAHRGLSKLHIVGSMHERKAMMADLSDAFAVLPGGYGTLDEMCEILTWAQLGIHQKPIVLINTNGFWDPFLAMLDHAVREGFLKAVNRGLLLVAPDSSAAVQRLAAEMQRKPTSGAK